MIKISVASNKGEGRLTVAKIIKETLESVGLSVLLKEEPGKSHRDPMESQLPERIKIVVANNIPVEIETRHALTDC